MGRSKHVQTKILKIKCIFVLCFLAVLIGIAKTNCYSYDKKILSSMELLKNAHNIESKYVGEAGKVSKLFLAYNVLANAKNSELLFINTFNGAKTDAGKVYCMIWFYENRIKLYEKYKTKMNRHAEIEIQIHCIAKSYRIIDILNMIEDGELIKKLRYNRSPSKKE